MHVAHLPCFSPHSMHIKIDTPMQMEGKTAAVCVGWGDWKCLSLGMSAAHSPCDRTSILELKIKFCTFISFNQPLIQPLLYLAWGKKCHLSDFRDLLSSGFGIRDKLSKMKCHSFPFSWLQSVDMHHLRRKLTRFLAPFSHFCYLKSADFVSFLQHKDGFF